MPVIKKNVFLGILFIAAIILGAQHVIHAGDEPSSGGGGGGGCVPTETCEKYESAITPAQLTVEIAEPVIQRFEATGTADYNAPVNLAWEVYRDTNDKYGGFSGAELCTMLGGGFDNFQDEQYCDGTVFLGACLSLKGWQTRNVNQGTTECTGNDCVSDSASINVTSDTTFTLQCSAAGKTVSRQIATTVNPPSIGGFTAVENGNPSNTAADTETLTVNYNGAATINWTGTSTSGCTVNGTDVAGTLIGGTASTYSYSYPASGITTSTAYAVSCGGSGTPATASVTITPPPPVVGSFSFANAQDTDGDGINEVDYGNDNFALSWAGAASFQSCAITDGSGTVRGDITAGTSTGSPSDSATGNTPVGVSGITQNTTYTLTCSGFGADDAKSLDVVVNPPSISGFTVNNTNDNITVDYEDPVVLKWNSTSAGTCTGTGFDAGDAMSNTTIGVTVNPTTTTEYTLTCAGATGTTAATISRTVTVNPPTASLEIKREGEADTLYAASKTINYDSSVVVRWGSTSAGSCTGTSFDTGGATSGTATVSNVTIDTTYTVTCTGDGVASASVSTTINPPSIGSFNANVSMPAGAWYNGQIDYGQPATLTWVVTNAESCSISGDTNGDGTNETVAGALTGGTNADGTWTAGPTAALTDPDGTVPFTVTCDNGNGDTDTSTATVNVWPQLGGSIGVVGALLPDGLAYQVNTNVRFTANPTGGREAGTYRYYWEYPVGTDDCTSSTEPCGWTTWGTVPLGDYNPLNKRWNSAGSKTATLHVKSGTQEFSTPTTISVQNETSCNNILRSNIVPGNAYFSNTPWPDSKGQVITWNAPFYETGTYTWSTSGGSCTVLAADETQYQCSYTDAGINRTTSLTVDVGYGGSSASTIHVAPELPKLLTPSITVTPSADAFIVGRQVTFAANTYNRSSGYTDNWQCWEDGNGNGTKDTFEATSCGTGTGATWAQTFSTSGSKVIVLTVTDRTAADSASTYSTPNQTATTATSIHIKPTTGDTLAGRMSVSPGPYYSGEAITFTTTQSNGVSPFAYEWFKDGTFVAETSNTYTTTFGLGTHDVSVRITDSATRNVLLNTQIQAGEHQVRRLKAYIVPPSEPYTQSNNLTWRVIHNGEEEGQQRSEYAGGGYIYNWSGAGGITSTAGKSFTTNYSTPGAKTISVTVTAPSGQQVTASAEIQVFENNSCSTVPQFSIAAQDITLYRSGGATSGTVPITVMGTDGFSAPVTLSLDTRTTVPECGDGIDNDDPPDGMVDGRGNGVDPIDTDCVGELDEDESTTGLQITRDSRAVVPLERCTQFRNGRFCGSVLNGERYTLSKNTALQEGAGEFGAIFKKTTQFIQRALGASVSPSDVTVTHVGGGTYQTAQLGIDLNGTPTGTYNIGIVGTGSGAEKTTLTLTVCDTPDAGGCGAPSVSLTADPLTVNLGQQTNITWTTQNVSGCVLESDDGNFVYNASTETCTAGNCLIGDETGELPDGTRVATPAGGEPDTVRYTLTCAQGDLVTSAFVDVGINGPLQITTQSPLPSATEGTAYSLTLRAAGGSGAYSSWRIEGDSPLSELGLTLDDIGVISGTIANDLILVDTASRNYTFKVQVEDSVGAIAEKTFTMTIFPQEPTISVFRATDNPIESDQSAELNFTTVDAYRVFLTGEGFSTTGTEMGVTAGTMDTPALSTGSYTYTLYAYNKTVGDAAVNVADTVTFSCDNAVDDGCTRQAYTIDVNLEQIPGEGESCTVNSDCNPGLICGVGNTCENPAAPTAGPTIHYFYAEPNPIEGSERTGLNWSVVNLGEDGECRINDTPVSGSASDYSVGPLSASTTYNLRCTANGITREQSTVVIVHPTGGDTASGRGGEVEGGGNTGALCEATSECSTGLVCSVGGTCQRPTIAEPGTVPVFGGTPVTFEDPAEYILSFNWQGQPGESCTVATVSEGESPDSNARWEPRAYPVNPSTKRAEGTEDFIGIHRGTYTYNLSCGVENRASIAINVVWRPTCDFFADDGDETEIILPDSAELRWSCDRAATCVLTSNSDDQVLNVQVLNTEDGTFEVTPETAARYTLTCTSPDGYTTSRDVNVTPFEAGLREVIPR